MAHPQIRPRVARPAAPSVGAGPSARRGPLAVRFGFNPNSSSLGIDISFLLMGLAGVSVVTAAASAFLGAARVRGDAQAPDSQASDAPSTEDA